LEFSDYVLVVLGKHSTWIKFVARRYNVPAETLSPMAIHNFIEQNPHRAMRPRS